MRKQLWNWSVNFSLFNGILFLAICWRFLDFFPTTDNTVAAIFKWVAYSTHAFSLAFAVLPLALLLILIAPSKRLLFTVLISLKSATAILLIIDSFVFASYRFHLNGMVWNLITGGAVAEILPLSTKTILVSSAIILLIIVAEICLAQILFKSASSKSIKRSMKAFGLVFLLIFVGQLFYAWADATGNTLITRQARYLPAYKPLTMKRSLRKMGFNPPAAERMSMEMKEASTLSYPLKELNYQKTMAELPNVMVVMIDSLRFDVMDETNTPAIYNMVDSSWNFTNHHSSGNSTRFGVFGFFYGIYATYWHSVLAEQKSPLLMREFVKNDYQFAIHASAPLTNPEFHRTIFADLKGSFELRQKSKRVVDRDREITDKMINSIKSRNTEKPFMGFLFYDAPHANVYPEGIDRFQPALKSVNHLELDENFDRVPYFNRFKNAVYYSDTLVAEIIQTLQDEKILDNTILIITGDHGEEFNELKNNYWGHNGSFSRFQTKVPLLIRWPNGEKREFSHMSSHLDIAPTLLNRVFGVQNDPAEFSNGRSLTDNSPRRYTLASNWSKFAVIEPERITVVYPAGDMETYSNDYRLIDGAKIDPPLAADVMRGMSKFLAR